MSQRGRGSCPGCKAEYFNRTKPANCAICGFFIGGKFEPASKKPKHDIPIAVKIADGIYSVKTSNRDDRCFVTYNGTLWHCSSEDCKLSRSVAFHSARLTDFSCKHIQGVRSSPSSDPCLKLVPNLSSFPCSENMKQEMQDILTSSSFESPVLQVTVSTFAVLGPATASNPLGFCHVHKSGKSPSSNVTYLCSGKDCKKMYASRGKQSRTKSMCIHVNMLLSCLHGIPHTSNVSETTTNPEEVKEPSTTSTPSSYHTKRTSTITLASMQKSLPYHIPCEIFQQISKYDAATFLGMPDGWPVFFTPVEDTCQLCHSALGGAVMHPGQSHKNSSYLLTELNPFKKVEVRVKFCSSQDCLAMHQPSVEKLGLFNISDKLLVSLDILQEFREFFKRSHPIGNIISAKVSVLSKKCQVDCPSPSELRYIEDLLYNGFFCFEMVSQRSLNDVICGICGVAPEICLGDGNEKNSCSNIQIDYPKKDEDKKEMMTLDSFLSMLTRRWIEKTVYTRVQEGFSVRLEQLPPLLPPLMAADVVFNTEMDKKSVYLGTSKQPIGDPAVLHKLVMNGELEMENINKYDIARVVQACSSCKIPTQGKSKEFLCGELYRLYQSILIGSCPCHSFGKLNGRTGGYYHFVCRHGTTVASKFLALAESVRDAADLYISLKNPPAVLISDTPCGFVRHMECRDPERARKLWGENAGCFERPQLGKEPTKDQNVPTIVPSEYRSDTTEQGKTSHFVLGDRFHASSEPHKSPLCRFHDIDLCLQANAIKTSTQESQNHRKNEKRLRSSCMQSFEVHLVFNYLMDFYENEEIVIKQRQVIERSLLGGQNITRDNLMRFVVN